MFTYWLSCEMLNNGRRISIALWQGNLLFDHYLCVELLIRLWLLFILIKPQIYKPLDLLGSII